MTAYVAGPMTGIEGFNYPAFHRAVRTLRYVGIPALSAAHDEFGEPVDPPTPDDAKPYGYYLRHALRILLDCDEVVLLPGWEESRGASIEVKVAQALGMPVIELGPRIIDPIEEMEE